MKLKYLPLTLAFTLTTCGFPLPPLPDEQPDEQIVQEEEQSDDEQDDGNEQSNEDIEQDDEEEQDNGNDEDNDNGEETNPEPEQPQYPDGYHLNSYTEFSDYSVGDNFDFYARVQNKTTENLFMNNTTDKNLEYKLFRNDVEVYSDKIQEDFDLLFNEQGYFQADYKGNSLELEVSNAELDYDGKHYNLPAPLTFTKTIETDPYVLQQAGNYHTELSLVYTANDTTYQSTFKSEDFQVE